MILPRGLKAVNETRVVGAGGRVARRARFGPGWVRVEIRMGHEHLARICCRDDDREITLVVERAGAQSFSKLRRGRMKIPLKKPDNEAGRARGRILD